MSCIQTKFTFSNSCTCSLISRPPSGWKCYNVIRKVVLMCLSILYFPLFFFSPSVQASTQLTSPLASPTQSPTPSPSGSVSSVCPGLGPLPLISQFPRPGGPAQGTNEQEVRRFKYIDIQWTKISTQHLSFRSLFSWVETFSVHTRTYFSQIMFAHLFHVSGDFSFAKIIHHPDRCGISKC